jgi:uncharacterized membrane protein YiaA
VTEKTADDYEKSIREKVYKSGILTVGEWVYLVGLFQAARDLESLTRDDIEAPHPSFP